MAYRLMFTPIETDLFRVCWDCFQIWGNATRREEHLITNRILDKLESISVPDASKPVLFGDPNDPFSAQRRQLNPEGGYVVLEDTEYQYLKRTMDRIESRPNMSRALERLYQLLDNATPGDAKALVIGQEAAKESAKAAAGSS
jgi:hypothetical protein